ncbi:MAG TPA: D-aminoacyl-tRNA deacylase [Bacillota bacterium]|nr:D-aminoacyl-tRNA deacylase [Bacillota bacterium]
MRAVVQRVKSAQVSVDGKLVGRIGPGLMVLLGVAEGDGPEDVRYMVDKIPNLRVFDDADGKMNLSCLDVGGSVLAVSQFTLLGDCRRGRRPSFTAAAGPDLANALYEQFVQGVRELGIVVETGVFRAEMEVSLTNHGPVTIILDSSKSF